MYIGKQQVRSHTEDGNRITVVYDGGQVEIFSKKMFNTTKTEKPTDPSELRDLRIVPVVAEILEVMRNWGVKKSELGYLSTLLNTSLVENNKEAVRELWSKWMPKPDDPDDVDLITVDRVLKSVKPSLSDILGKKRDDK